MPVDFVKLHCHTFSSDKVYELRLVHNGDVLWDVFYAHGRRTSGPTSGNKAKNEHPLSYGAAQMFMQDMIYEKQRKGYHLWGECNLCSNLFSAPQVVTGPGTIYQPVDYLEAENKVLKEMRKGNPPLQPIEPKTVAPKTGPRTINFDDDDL